MPLKVIQPMYTNFSIGTANNIDMVAVRIYDVEATLALFNPLKPSG
jgi:hypothetical protein